MINKIKDNQFYLEIIKMTTIIKEYDYTDWHDDLRNMLAELFVVVWPDDPNKISKLLSEDTMYIWGLAFTSDSFDSEETTRI